MNWRKVVRRGEVVDRVVGLKLGADDYEPMELMARIEALLRRSGGVPASTGHAELGDVRIDLRKQEVTRGGIPLAFSPVECRLLEYLIARRGAVVTREELLENVWSLHGDTLSRTVDVHIAGLRKKIEADPRYPLSSDGEGCGVQAGGVGLWAIITVSQTWGRPSACGGLQPTETWHTNWRM